MATAHGTGLMIAPLVLSLSTSSTGTAEMAHVYHVHHVAMGVAPDLGVSLGILVHTLAMLAVIALVAWFVYKRFGLRILRSHWINFDLIWAGALLFMGWIALLRSFGVS